MRGLKDPIQVEHAIEKMTEHQIGAFLLQETWIKGGSVKKIRGCTMLMRSLDHHNSGRGERGVAIILSPKCFKHYGKDGCFPPTTTCRNH